MCAKTHGQSSLFRAVLCGTAFTLVLGLTGCGTKTKETGDLSWLKQLLPTSAAAQQEESEPANENPEAKKRKPANDKILDYDKIQPVCESQWIPYRALLQEGKLRYYTVEKDGLWGLIRVDGTVVLPCEAKTPVFLCGLGAWYWDAPLDLDQIETIRKTVAENGDGIFDGCGHGAQSEQYIWLEAEREKGAQYYWTDEGSGMPVKAQKFATQGGWLPVMDAEMAENERLGGMSPAATGKGYNFANADGALLLPDCFFENAGWFSNQPLAPVKKDGKWAYIDQAGAYKTEFLYDDAWGFTYGEYQEETGIYEIILNVQAYDLYDGFAPVSRGGKWGVIDASGKEIVSCEYDGAVPCDGGVWLQQEGVWRQYLL